MKLRFLIVAFSSGLCLVSSSVLSAADGSRFAHSDSDARYLHHIDLYDANNRKITPSSTQPYSSVKTCGRCHDYERISHGWHFNAFSPDAVAGRPGEPWIWSDPRTATQLPLSYRDSQEGVARQGYDPRKLGISPWEMTHHFGGRIPGGGVGVAAEPTATEETAAAEGDESDENGAAQVSRWQFSGSLDIDCMVCHAVSGAYDFHARREQIEEENFAWAATAALRLGAVDGDVSRIKDDADPSDEATQAKLPKLTYDPARFAADGTVFMDLVRQPPSNSCYQCHSYRTVTESGIESRWVHDEDVHLRAGMVCADCHRNGIDHHIVRGFDGEQHPSGNQVETLSCAGCHLGTDHGHGELSEDVLARPGRLGSPRPLHAGLPPLHFEKLTCTACHGGPVPRDEAIGIMTSLSHGLGVKEHRSGQELPLIVGPVYAKQSDGRVAPHRAMWPAFWATIQADGLKPIPPNQVYDLTRRALRVRTSFVDEVLKQELSSKDLKQLLGEERAKVDAAEWSEDERRQVDAAQAEAARQLFNEKVYAALEALETELGSPAAYVSSGHVYTRGEQEDTLAIDENVDQQSVAMVRWPTAHNVRPAGWSLGAAGCVECHSDEGKIFASTVTPTGPGPDDGKPTTMATLQGVNTDVRLAWNELFKGRKDFKYIIGGSIAVLLIVFLIGVGAMAARLATRKGRTA